VIAVLSARQSSVSRSDVPEDQTAVLQQQFDALQPGASLKLEAVVYPHSGVLKIRVPGVHIDGSGAILQATSDATSSVQILADDVTLTNIKLSAPGTGPRMHGTDQQKLLVAGDGDIVSNISVAGSAAAGVFVNGAQNFTLTDIDVANTRADGVHITSGASHGVLSNIRTAQTGDDGVAVVSYQDDPLTCTDISINDVVIRGNTHGRGLSIVGATDVRMRGFSIANTQAAGVYVATEGNPY
jgi:hypothetical protein